MAETFLSRDAIGVSELATVFEVARLNLDDPLATQVRYSPVDRLHVAAEHFRHPALGALGSTRYGRLSCYVAQYSLLGGREVARPRVNRACHDR